VQPPEGAVEVGAVEVEPGVVDTGAVVVLPDPLSAALTLPLTKVSAAEPYSGA
jgi:hypothetical protein